MCGCVTSWHTRVYIQLRLRPLPHTHSHPHPLLHQCAASAAVKAISRGSPHPRPHTPTASVSTSGTDCKWEDRGAGEDRQRRRKTGLSRKLLPVYASINLDGSSIWLLECLPGQYGGIKSFVCKIMKMSTVQKRVCLHYLLSIKRSSKYKYCVVLHGHYFRGRFKTVKIIFHWQIKLSPQQIKSHKLFPQYSRLLKP